MRDEIELYLSPRGEIQNSEFSFSVPDFPQIAALTIEQGSTDLPGNILLQTSKRGQYCIIELHKTTHML